MSIRTKVSCSRAVDRMVLADSIIKSKSRPSPICVNLMDKYRG